MVSDTSLASRIDTVVVVLRDSVRMPEGLIRKNRGISGVRDVQFAIIQIRAKRAALYAKLDSVLTLLPGAITLETYWLTQTAAVQLPIGRIPDLAQWDEIVSIEPKDGLAPPNSGGCYDSSHPVESGRAAMGSEAYFCCAQEDCSDGALALLDTGVYVDHVLLNDPDRLLPLADCVSGSTDCVSGDIYQGDVASLENQGHGSMSAAIVAGNRNKGREYEGVTSAAVESYRVFPVPGTGDYQHVVTTAAERAFDAAIATRHLLIVAELAADVDEDGSLSRAAGNAFDLGVVVIAANGNLGEGHPVPAPANSPWAIGVGAYCLGSNDFDAMTTHGRPDFPNGLVKPDLVAPSGAVTVNGKPNGGLQVFSETSGATPFAAGAAHLIEHCLTATDTETSAGDVYAHMILYGNAETINTVEGAGRIQLPQKGILASWRGTAEVESGQAWTIDLELKAGDHGQLKVAIWWPDPRNGTGGYSPENHSDVDLYLMRRGELVARSEDYGSVFEKAATTIERLSATERAQAVVSGFSIPSGVQKVYYAAMLTAEAHP